MSLAEHEVLGNPDHGRDLPPSWRTLYDLSRLPDATLEQAFVEGAIDGWLAYGAALNEGRSLHTSENGIEDDRGFGGWIADNDLGQLAQGQVEPKEQQAAMWAAANADQFEEARAASNARTVRPAKLA